METPIADFARRYADSGMIRAHMPGHKGKDVYKRQQTEGASAPSDEVARRMKREILCLQQQMAFLKKVMQLHGKPGE